MVDIQDESIEEMELEDEDGTADVAEGAALGRKATSCIALKPHEPIGCFQCVGQNDCTAN
jgi:hypothetical protein